MAQDHISASPRVTYGPLLKVSVALAALASVVAGKLLIGLGLRRAPEGWRRTLGVLLRSEPTRFALSAFGLRVPHAVESGSSHSATINERLAKGLRQFLASESDAHFGLEWERWVTTRRRAEWVDVVLLTFSAAGALETIEPYLSPARPEPLGPELRKQMDAAVVDAYNRTRDLPEIRRTRALLEKVGAVARSGEAQAYVSRILGSCCLVVETIDVSDPAQRFAPPPFFARRTLGFGFLSVVARLESEGETADIWLSAHHVGLDGVPLQELLTRLEVSWGNAAPVTFPAPTGRAVVGPQGCSAPGERPVEFALTFVDFSPLRSLRGALNTRYAKTIGSDVTFGALLAWLVSREPEFSGVKIASTVDVAASDGYHRDVDVVPLRAADFASGSGPWDGLVEYVREFNRLVEASRARTSPLRREMQTAGLLPPRVHALAVHSNPAALDVTFGSLCITIIRDAYVFVAPMTDLGLGLGFLAIGNMDLPTADGRRVAAVTIKGDAGTISNYPAVLQRLVDRGAALEQAL